LTKSLMGDPIHTIRPDPNHTNNSLTDKKDTAEPEKADQASPISFCSVHSVCRFIKLSMRIFVCQKLLWRISQESKCIDSIVKCKTSPTTLS
jgi:hypothetical protein